MTNQQTFLAVLSPYRERAIGKGSELLLRPEDALRFVDDLERLGIVILGVIGWHYVYRSHNLIVQELETDLDILRDVNTTRSASAQSAELARKFIVSGLKPYTEFVSFLLDVPSAWTQALLGM
jgi:hypothetical protein